jgi:anti-sigma regulatory factor (Ser/Thr protein kinase)
MNKRSTSSASEPAAPQSSRVQRDFARSFDSLDAIFAFVQPVLSTHGAGEGESFAIFMTIEELFTNMVKYNATGSGCIGLEIECDADAVICRISDPDSERFDPTQAPDVDIHQPVEQRRPGGLGIHLIRRLVDTLDYAYDGRRSTITFRKKLDRGAAGDDSIGSAAGGSDQH